MCLAFALALPAPPAAPPHTKLHNHAQPDAMAPYSAQHVEALSTIQKAESSIADCQAQDVVAEENVNQVDL